VAAVNELREIDEVFRAVNNVVNTRIQPVVEATIRVWDRAVEKFIAAFGDASLIQRDLPSDPPARALEFMGRNTRISVMTNRPPLTPQRRTPMSTIDRARHYKALVKSKQMNLDEAARRLSEELNGGLTPAGAKDTIAKAPPAFNPETPDNANTRKYGPIATAYTKTIRAVGREGDTLDKQETNAGLALACKLDAAFENFGGENPAAELAIIKSFTDALKANEFGGEAGSLATVLSFKLGR
jgi:hypothetical protein